MGACELVGLLRAVDQTGDAVDATGATGVVSGTDEEGAGED